MKLGEEVDTKDLVKLASSFAPALTEYSYYNRWMVKGNARDLFGGAYIITGKKKSTQKEYLLGHFQEHDVAITMMKKISRTQQQYKPHAIEHVLR